MVKDIYTVHANFRLLSSALTYPTLSTYLSIIYLLICTYLYLSTVTHLVPRQ